MGNAISALTMVWEKRYISDDQREQIYWEFFNFCSFVWQHPIQTAAFLICAPWLIKILFFFYPLLISTVLFLLIIFSLGPQLERMRADSDLQWHRFREAAVSDEDGGGGSCECPHSFEKLAIGGGVNRKMASAVDWIEWTESHEELDRSIFYTEEHPSNCIEKNDKKVDFVKPTEGEVEQDREGQIGVSSKSLVLVKVGELMETLIHELGGRVELDALDALESITQVLIESTGRDAQNVGKFFFPFSMRIAGHELSDDEQFHTTLYVGDCEFVSREGCTTNSESLELAPRENIEVSGDDEKEGKNSSLLAITEVEYKQSDTMKLHTNNCIGDTEFITRQVTVKSQTDVGHEHEPGTSKDKEEQGKSLILLSTEYELLDEGHFQTGGHAGDSEFTASTENVMVTCNEQDKAVPVSLVESSCCAGITTISGQPQEGDANPSVSQHVGTSDLVQDTEQKSDRISGFEQYELRTCRSLPVENLKNEFRCMDKLWEEHEHDGLVQKSSAICKGKDHQEHYPLSSSSLGNQEHRIKQHCVLAVELRSCPSEPMTFVKKPLLLASPGTEGMDLLWEKYNDASQGPESARKDPIADLDGNLSEIVDSDAEDLRETSQVCCLQALKFSKGRMPLRKPNLKKISKALKKLGLLQHFRRRKTA